MAFDAFMSYPVVRQAMCILSELSPENPVVVLSDWWCMMLEKFGKCCLLINAFTSVSSAYMFPFINTNNYMFMMYGQVHMIALALITGEILYGKRLGTIEKHLHQIMNITLSLLWLNYKYSFWSRCKIYRNQIIKQTLVFNDKTKRNICLNQIGSSSLSLP